MASQKTGNFPPGFPPGAKSVNRSLIGDERARDPRLSEGFGQDHTLLVGNQNIFVSVNQKHGRTGRPDVADRTALPRRGQPFGDGGPEQGGHQIMRLVPAVFRNHAFQIHHRIKGTHGLDGPLGQGRGASWNELPVLGKGQ